MPEEFTEVTFFAEEYDDWWLITASFRDGMLVIGLESHSTNGIPRRITRIADANGELHETITQYLATYAPHWAARGVNRLAARFGAVLKRAVESGKAAGTFGVLIGYTLIDDREEELNALT